MKIALLADDAKKELMIQFCIAYCGILSKHSLCATGRTGRMVSEATGLPIYTFLGGFAGGEEQITSYVSCNEIDLVLFFRDTIVPADASAVEGSEAAQNLFRLCDVYNIPYATNIATAEALIHSLENGDLDWRNIVHSNSEKTF